MKRASCWLSLMGLALSVVACGSDGDDSGTGGSAGTSGAGGTGGSSGGVGGTAGTASAGTAGTGGSIGGTGGAAGSGGTGGQVPQAWIDACADEAKEVCELYQACYPNYAPIVYGTVAQCEQSRTSYCAALYREDGITPESFAACTAARAALWGSDCYDFALVFNNGPAMPNPPTECQFKGTTAVGDPCEIPAQCASGFCGNFDGTEQLCGVCLAAPAAGEACPDGACDFGAKCVAGTCRVLKILGETCDADSPCASGYWCDTGTCAKRKPVGSDCDPQSRETLCEGDAICNSATKKCDEMKPTAEVGEPCWIQADQTIVGCKDSWCQISTSTGKGTCVTKKEQGEACLVSQYIVGNSSDCRLILSCVNGICREQGDVLVCH